MSAVSSDSELLILDTGLFVDKETLSEALETLNLPPSQRRKLLPASMNDTDWDEIISLVLSARCVITL